MADLAVLAARFGARLRAEGLPVGPERSARFAAAVTLVDPRTVPQLYWWGWPRWSATRPRFPPSIGSSRSSSAVRPTSPSPAATRARRRSGPGRSRRPRSGRAGPGPARSSRWPAPRRSNRPRRSAEEPDVDSPFPALAAAAERLGHRDFASLSPDELARLVAVMRQLRLATPLRRSRRYEAGSRGRRIDLRTTMRLAQRSGGFPVRLARHRLRLRHRRLVVLCDISGLHGAVRAGAAAASSTPRPRSAAPGPRCSRSPPG